MAFAALSCIVPSRPAAAWGPDDADLGFKAAFHRPVYQKKYFGLAVTGTAIVAAGAFTYFTAGAGAPAAATGVGSVASWVGGGGAGSYMAGLSTVGGWFGGNAMLGSAILNGISLGTVGGMGAWSSYSAGQKALALSVTAATVMDGVAVVSKPGTAQLEWRMVLPVPKGLADKRILRLVDALDEANKELASLAAEVDAGTKKANAQAPDSAARIKLNKALQELAAAKGRHVEVTRQVNAEIDQALKSGETKRNTVVLAVLANNFGRPAEFRALLGRVKESLSDASYFDYLQAVAALQTGRIAEAERLLYGAIGLADFAIEPPILLVIVLGRRGYAAQEAKIEEVVSYAVEHFKADKYMPVASLVSLHYRVGTMALGAKRCDRALDAFEKAKAELSLVEKFWNGKGTRDFLDLGVANALHCQGKRDEAYAVFDEVWKRSAKTDDAKALLCVQFVGGCSRS